MFEPDYKTGLPVLYTTVSKFCVKYNKYDKITSISFLFLEEKNMKGQREKLNKKKSILANVCFVARLL